MFKRKKILRSKANDEVSQSQTTEVKAVPFCIDEQDLTKYFKDADDVFFNTSMFGGQEPVKITLIGCQGMVDLDLMNRLVIDRLNSFLSTNSRDPLTKDNVLQSLHLPQLKEVESKDKMFADIYCGKLLLYFHEDHFLFSVNISHRPQRTPEETAIEITINGPRDNFIEDLSINTALIRKRLRTNSLRIKKFEVGKRSLTEVALLYIHDTANPKMVEMLMKKIKEIDVDGIYSGNQFMELIEKPSPFLPRHHYTGRPDFAVHCLLQGRLIILIDGISYAIIVPIDSFFLLKTAEDAENISAFSSFERILRIIGVFAATLLPGFWVAITTYHQDHLPLIFLATVVESRRGIPLPTAFEAILMLVLFELFKEAGLRMPSAAGGTLSVLGALIIGDAAIRAGLTSPAMLVIIAGSSIATFTLVNHSLIGAISVARLACIMLSSILGLFGFLFSLHFLLIAVCNIRVLGLPFFNFTANLSIKNVLKSFLRLPSRLNTSRISPLLSKDPTKKEE
nr:spore germination protein [uncultured Bacillus sp.]